MMRFIMPIILTGIAITLFFAYTNPIYSKISANNLQIASYDEALGNSKTLQSQRDKLTLIYNGIDPNNLVKLQKLLPDNVDNIRLILEIEQIASPYNMALTGIQYNATDSSNTTTAANAPAVAQVGGVKTSSGDYGTFNLEFSTSGSYNNFLNFTKDLESNLRIVDISSITFSSDTSATTKVGVPEVYKYDFKIKTYWLKN